MRVGVVWECPWVPSSYGKLSLWVAYGLQRLGFSVRVYCPSAPDVTLYSRYTLYSPACDYRDVGICLDLDQPLQVASDRRLGGDRDIDVYLIGGSPYGQVESRWVSTCSRLRQPVAGYFVTESDLVPPHLSSWLLHVDAVGFPTRAVAEAFLTSRAVAEAHREYVVAPHGLPDYYFRADREALVDYLLKGVEPTEGLALALESREAGSLVGAVAKNHPRKDFGALLAAFALARRASGNPRLRLLLAAISAAGGGEWDVPGIAYALGLTHRDVIPLSADQRETGVTEAGVLQLYSLVNAFAFPTLGEGFGLPPVEAAALGIPAVVTRTPVTEEVWGPSYPLLVESYPRVAEEGFVLHATDYTDLAQKILEALGGAQRYGRVSRSVAEGYTLRRMVEGVVRLLELAVEKAGTKRPHPLEKYDHTPVEGYGERLLRILGNARHR